MNELLVFSKNEAKKMLELYVGLKDGTSRLYLTHDGCIEKRLSALDPNISEYCVVPLISEEKK